jgi:hypothetical protein
MQPQPTILKDTHDARATAPATAGIAVDPALVLLISSNSSNKGEALPPVVAATGEELQFDMELGKHCDHHHHHHHHHHHRRHDIDDENGDTDVEETSPPASAAISRKPSFASKS